MKILIAIVSLVSMSNALAGPHAEPAPQILQSKTFAINKRGDRVDVRIRKDGIAMGRPYLIEILPQCLGKAGRTLASQVESVCAVDMKIVKFLERENRVIVRVKETFGDLVNFNSVNNRSEPIYCRASWTLKTFEMNQICP